MPKNRKTQKANAWQPEGLQVGSGEGLAPGTHTVDPVMGSAFLRLP